MMASEDLRARPIEAVERPGRKIAIKLGAVRGELCLQAIKDALRQAAGVIGRLHHDRRHGADQHSFRHPAFAMAPDVVCDLAATGGVANMHRILQVEMRGQCREIVGIVIHVMAVAGLGGAAVATAIMRDDAKALVEEEEHLSVPVISRKRPTMAEDDRLSRAPILIKISVPSLTVMLGISMSSSTGSTNPAGEM